jgi:apolipoprotein N-acyltransferase
MRGIFDNRQYHHKVHRVPFGEYLPFRDTLPFMEPVFGSLFPRDFAKGRTTEPLHLEKPALQLIPLICFEDTVGRVARMFVRDAPQVIVNLSNDGWFLQSAETEIHLVNSIFRAIELRRPMVRCSNTGITCVVDLCGRARNMLSKDGSTFIEGVLTDEVRAPVNPPVTIYARFGDWFSVTMLLIAAAHAGRKWRNPQP